MKSWLTKGSKEAGGGARGSSSPFPAAAAVCLQPFMKASGNTPACDCHKERGCCLVVAEKDGEGTAVTGYWTDASRPWWEGRNVSWRHIPPLCIVSGSKSLYETVLGEVGSLSSSWYSDDHLPSLSAVGQMGAQHLPGLAHGAPPS